MDGKRVKAARGAVINTSFLVALNVLGLMKGFLIAGFITVADYGVWGLLLASFAASQVPMSRARMPSMGSGRPYLETCWRRSNQPSATRPSHRSIVWYQSCSCTRAAMSAVADIQSSSPLHAQSAPAPYRGSASGTGTGFSWRTVYPSPSSRLADARRGLSSGQS
jgi:hypothetical protein